MAFPLQLIRTLNFHPHERKTIPSYCENAQNEFFSEVRIIVIISIKSQGVEI